MVDVVEVGSNRPQPPTMSGSPGMQVGVAEVVLLVLQEGNGVRSERGMRRPKGTHLEVCSCVLDDTLALEEVLVVDVEVVEAASQPPRKGGKPGMHASVVVVGSGREEDDEEVDAEEKDVDAEELEVVRGEELVDSLMPHPPRRTGSPGMHACDVVLGCGSSELLVERDVVVVRVVVVGDSRLQPPRKGGRPGMQGAVVVGAAAVEVDEVGALLQG